MSVSPSVEPATLPATRLLLFIVLIVATLPTSFSTFPTEEKTHPALLGLNGAPVISRPILEVIPETRFINSQRTISVNICCLKLCLDLCRQRAGGLTSGIGRVLNVLNNTITYAPFLKRRRTIVHKKSQRYLKVLKSM